MITKTPRPATPVVLGQPSWRLASSAVEAFVTELGGHLGPVTFGRGGRRLAPFHTAPWAEEPVDPGLPAILRVLRGDFFCMPFGGNETPFRGERHPVHGETANARWKLESLERRGDRVGLHLSLRTRVRKGRVDKRIIIAGSHDAVYCEHVISGMSGPMCLGHHAMLRFPDRPGSGVLSMSPFVFGQVCPLRLEDPEQRGYSTLRPGARFERLEEVEMVTGETTDLMRYPARRGFEDLVMVMADPDLPFAWSAVTFPKERFAWFALKDPRVLTGTTLWISNGGRHYPPWSGRHVNVLGIEEVTSYFHYGLAESARPNPLSRQGLPTCFLLDARKPLAVRYILGVVPIPAGFDRVADVRPLPGGLGIELLSASRKSARAMVDPDFLQAGAAAGVE